MLPLETDGGLDVPTGPKTLLDGEGGRIGFRVNELLEELPDSLGVAVTRVVDEEVMVTGQTVVETGTIIVLTGQSLMPGPQL
jgi:hypothetical protein